jgi:hypothetical protein
MDRLMKSFIVLYACLVVVNFVIGLTFQFLRDSEERFAGLLLFFLKLHWVFLVAAFQALVVAAFVWPFLLAAAFESVREQLIAHPWLRLVFISSSIALGYAMTLLKRRLRWLFGVIQFSGGIAACWTVMPASQTHETGITLVAAFAAGVYIVVDGLDNMVQGWAE